jgi:8-oxo-dGTP diphosphatase
VRLYVVRHAHAGHRTRWDGHDPARPLTRKGRRQSEAIADVLEAAGVERLVSSGYDRCIQTFEPLAARLGLPVEADPRLEEGGTGEGALTLADELRADHETAALCSHGDVIPDMLHVLRSTTTRFRDPLVWPKASTWVLTWDDDCWSRARYIAPPEVAVH